MSDFEHYQIIPELITGIVHIKQNSQYHNIDADEVHVYEGVQARLFGNVKYKITLKQNSKLFLHGSFKGEIINSGGRIYIFENGG